MTVIKSFFRKAFVLLSSFILINTASAQLQDSGGIGSVGLQKSLTDIISLNFEQELRFDRDFSSFKRSGTMIGGEIDILPNTLSAELNYILFYRRAKDEAYEFTHRFVVAVSGKYHIGDFIFKLKTRVQSTLLDGEHPENKYNPKTVWRNRLQVEYPIVNTTFTPFVSAESFTPLNGSNNAFVIEYRLVGGTKIKIDKTNSLSCYLRYDQTINVLAPTNILYVVVAYNFNL